MAEYVGQTSAPLTQPHNTIGIAPEACSVCFGLNATQYDNSDWKGLRSVALVLVSAWKGCAGCSVLVAVLLPYWEEAEFESFCEYGFRTYKNSFYVEFVKDSWWFPSILEIYTLTGTLNRPHLLDYWTNVIRIYVPLEIHQTNHSYFL